MTNLNATCKIKPTDETVARQKSEFKFPPEVAFYVCCSTDTVTDLKNLWEEAQAQLDTTRTTKAATSNNRAMIRQSLQVQKGHHEKMVKDANREEN